MYTRGVRWKNDPPLVSSWFFVGMNLSIDDIEGNVLFIQHC